MFSYIHYCIPYPRVRNNDFSLYYKDRLRSLCCSASPADCDWAGESGARAGLLMNYLTARQAFMTGLHGRSPKPSPHGIRPVSTLGRPTCVLSPSASESPQTNPPHASAADADADYRNSDGSVMPDVLANGREACYKVQPSATFLRSSAP